MNFAYILLARLLPRIYPPPRKDPRRLIRVSRSRITTGKVTTPGAPSRASLERDITSIVSRSQRRGKYGCKADSLFPLDLEKAVIHKISAMRGKILTYLDIHFVFRLRFVEAGIP